MTTCEGNMWKYICHVIFYKMESNFFKEIEREYSELLKTGKIEFIEEVKRKTSRHFFYKSPIYFIGDIKSKLVLVTFSSSKLLRVGNVNQPDFRTYQFKYQNYGKYYYDYISNEIPTQTLNSILREYNYLKPFQTIKFDKNSLKDNMQKLIDEKLHLDLIPYSTPDFSSDDFINNYTLCKPLIDSLLQKISAFPRHHVIFTDQCFLKILKEYIVQTDRFIFKLNRYENGVTNQQVVFTRIILKYQNRIMVAGIADSLYDESIDRSLLSLYGEASASILNRGVILSRINWIRLLN